MLIRLKFFIKQIHLILGLISGLVVFVVAVTGCIYCFEEEIRNVLYKDLLTVKPVTSSKPLNELLNIVRTEYPKPTIKSVKIKADRLSSIEIILKNKQSVFIDPYTGKVLGSIHKENDFFGIILKMHRTLYLGDVGKFITGTSATIFLFMIMSGIFLWWPKNKRFLKQKFSIKKNVHWKKTNYDIHTVLGFYAAWILLFTAATGIIWSFKWAENTMYQLSNSKKEAPKTIHSAYKTSALPISIDALTTLATSKQEQFISLPEDSVGVYKVFVRKDDGSFYKKQDQLFFDQYTGKLLHAKLFTQASTGDKLKANNYNIHTGKVFGIVGQLIVFFASLIAASLPITGFIMWRVRKKVQHNMY